MFKFVLLLLFLKWLDDFRDSRDNDDLNVGLEPCECDDYDNRSGFSKLLLLSLMLVSRGVDCGDDNKLRVSLYLLLLLL